MDLRVLAYWLVWLGDWQILKDTNVAGVINNLPTLKL